MIQKLQKIIVSKFVISQAILWPTLVFTKNAFAQASDTPINVNLPTPLLSNVTNDVNTVVFTGIFNFVFLMIGSLAVIAIIVSGIRYATSYGNPERMEKAKRNLTFAVIGLIVVLLGYTIAATINTVLLEL